jgi:hypothetical protein
MPCLARVQFRLAEVNRSSILVARLKVVEHEAKQCA